jgi:hypothetical protein
MLHIGPPSLPASVNVADESIGACAVEPSPPLVELVEDESDPSADASGFVVAPLLSPSDEHEDAKKASPIVLAIIILRTMSQPSNLLAPRWKHGKRLAIT